MDQGETQAESETMLAMDFDHVVSCCHDSNASGTRVLSHDVFHNAKVHFAIVIVKKYWLRILAIVIVKKCCPRALVLEPFVQK